MHFGFALDLSDIDLLNVDLWDQRYTHLDFFVSKTSWRRLEDMSSRHLQDMSWRRLEDVFSLTIFRLRRCLQDVFKTSSRRLGRRKIVTLKTFSRHVLKKPWRRLEDVLKSNKCLLGCYLYIYLFIHEFDLYFSLVVSDLRS